MMTVYKYELAETGQQRIAMPSGALLLHVEGQQVSEQTGQYSRSAVVPMLWAYVDTDKPMVDRCIAMVGTGIPAPEPWEAEYVGTAICGPFVWHVFDGGPVVSHRDQECLTSE